MLSKLPAWIGLGAFLLSFAAGCMNVFALEGVLHQAVTHQSGNATALALALSRGNLEQSLRLLALILAFMAGACLSGYIIRDYHLRLGRRYGVSLMAESLSIILAWMVYERAPFAALLLLSTASGLQNALATTYSGAVVRTTHLTGVFTDIGVMFGNSLAGIPRQPRKLPLLSAIAAGYVAGAFAGAVGFPLMGSCVLAVPAAISGIMGLSYFIYRHLVLKEAMPESGRD